MLKDYIILHGENPHKVFGPWCGDHKLSEWHTHPLGNTDSIVTLHLTSSYVRDELEQMEEAGRITRFPLLVSGETMPAKILEHPAMIAAGVLPGHRTWDAAKVLLNSLGWPQLHPERY